MKPAKREEAYGDPTTHAPKIIKYSNKANLRNQIAKRGKLKYFKYFNSSIIADYIINKTFNINPKKKYLWHKN